MSHTPGPWNYAECQMGAPFIETESAGDLFSAVLPLDEERANVRLIAAAPDLFAACEALVSGRKNDAVDMARAAIAKARGKP